MFLPGSHGQRSLKGYFPLSCKELDMTEVTKHACKLTGNILTRLPINESRKEEINTSPLKYVRTRKYLHQLTVFFFFLLYLITFPSLFCKRNYHPNLGKMFLWGTSPSSYLSAGFPNEVAISCPSDLSLHLVVCCLVSSPSSG